MPAELSNRILNALPAALKTTLLARMQPVDLPVGTVLYSPGQTPAFAHFMTSGIASVVTLMEDGSGVEVGLIASEGLVEAFHLLGPAAVHTTAFIQSAGTALRMSFAELQKEFHSNPTLRTLILGTAQRQALLVTQLAACNRLHEVEERLARWLLMVSDRVENDQFHLTQVFLAEMIGAQRTTVTLAAGSLQRSGLIMYRRGHIHILDREKLESAACECYPIMRDLRDLNPGLYA
jgi:CRP-like cAMP-binding protein